MQVSKRVVTYTRVSTEDQAKHGYSLPSQAEACRKYAEEQGWTVMAEISDDGISGAVLDRPGLDRIRDMSRAREIDAILVYELDRLSRKLVHQLIIEEELGKAGVSVYYVLGDYKDTDEGRLMKQIRASIAEYERAKIQERMRRGKRAKVKSGNVMTFGCDPYGYRLSKSQDGKTGFTIVEDEAQVVKLIYEWYVRGDCAEEGPMSIGTIAIRLTEMKIPTRGDRSDRVAKSMGYGKWSPAVVSRILRRETYCGVWHYGKKRKVNGKYVQNPRESWIAVPVPSIVDRNTWQAAQDRLRRNKALSRRNTKYEYLVGRRVTCGRCAYKMVGRSGPKRTGGAYLYYRCPGTYRSDLRHECDLPTFRAPQVDGAVWEWLTGFLMNSENLRQGLEARKAAMEDAHRPLRERLELLDDQFIGYRRQMERLLDLYLAGDFPKEVLAQRKAQLESIISGLEKERTSLRAQLDEAILTEEDIATIEEFAERVRAGLDNADFEAKRRVIELLDVQVVLNVEDGQKVAHVRCELGQELLIVSNTSRQWFGQGAGIAQVAESCYNCVE
jgi:site-specific DNA recombinase